MSKLKKTILFILLFGFMPISIYARESEVKYKYYIDTEKDVHYEQFCEYFEEVDYSDYMYTSPVYTNEKPEEKEGRVINVIDTIKVPGSNIYVDSLIFSDFYSESLTEEGYFTSLLTEIDIFDKDGKEVMYTKADEKNISYFDYINDGLYRKPAFLKKGSSFRAMLDSSYNVHDLTVRLVFTTHTMKDFIVKISGQYRYYENYIDGIVSFSDPVENCNADICYYDFKLSGSIMKDNYDYKETLYEYKDPLYKCYTKERIYVPGYYESLEGFTKDSEDFVEEEIIEEEPIEDNSNILLSEFLKFREENQLYLSNINQNIASLLSVNIEEEVIEEEVEEVIEEDQSELLAYNTEVVKEIKPSKSVMFILVFGLLSFTCSLLVFVRYLKICRTK